MEHEPAGGSPERITDFLPKGRLDAFADGVFAIAITLLVIELPVPTGSTDLLGALYEEWPDFLGYLISFSFIGSAWISHSGLTQLMRRGDGVSFRLNLLLLLLVSLLPFSTKLVAAYVREPGSETAVLVYGLNLFAASLMLSLLMRFTARRPELRISGLAEGEVRSMERKRRVALAVVAAGVVVALVQPAVAMALFVVQSVLLLLLPVFAEVVRGRGAHRV